MFFCCHYLPVGSSLNVSSEDLFIYRFFFFFKKKNSVGEGLREREGGKVELDK